MNQDARTERRYFVITPIAAKFGWANADVVDISTRGARLQVTEKIPTGQQVSFSMKIGEATIETTASAVWCDVAALSLQDEEPDRYFVGITFERSVSLIRMFINDLVATKSAIPIEENRNNQRYRVIAPLRLLRRTQRPPRSRPFDPRRTPEHSESADARRHRPLALFDQRQRHARLPAGDRHVVASGTAQRTLRIRPAHRRRRRLAEDGHRRTLAPRRRRH